MRPLINPFNQNIMKTISVLLSILLISQIIHGQEGFRKVNFDESFKKANRGKAKVEIDEVKELLHIMIAITKSGLENDDMVEQRGSYYKNVIQHFGPFKEEPIITRFDSLIKVNPLNYIFLTGNALSYNFKRDKLVADKNYLFPAQSVSAHTTITVNPITTYKKEIELFAKKTGFKHFYKQQLGFYNAVIGEYKKFANLQEQWDWLEKNFTTRVDNYTIMCSPLIGGLNYTTSYTDNHFKQIMMVLPALEKPSGQTEKQNIVFNTRIMFTEIDHNYISLPTKNNKAAIDVAFQNRSRWVDTTKDGTEYYPNPSKIFDEYMTFATFCLFCGDKFAGDHTMIKYAYDDVNSTLKSRGFIKAVEFNEELKRLKQNNPAKNVEELYPQLLDWCKKQ